MSNGEFSRPCHKQLSHQGCPPSPIKRGPAPAAAPLLAPSPVLTRQQSTRITIVWYSRKRVSMHMVAVIVQKESAHYVTTGARRAQEWAIKQERAHYVTMCHVTTCWGDEGGHSVPREGDGVKEGGPGETRRLYLHRGSGCVSPCLGPLVHRWGLSWGVLDVPTCTFRTVQPPAVRGRESGHRRQMYSIVSYTTFEGTH